MSMSASNLGFSISFARDTAKHIRRFSIVHIHAVRNFVTWWTMLWARRFRVPYIVAPQGSYEPWVLQRTSIKNRCYDQLFERPLLNCASAIQCLTSAEVQQVQALGVQAPCRIIPNGVRSGSSRFAKTGTQIAARGKRLLFLGRLHPKKGLDLLIPAFQNCLPRLPDLRLLVAGSDCGTGYLSEVEALTRELGLVDKVSFLGELHGEQKELCFANADAFALTSRSEGLPVAVLEAMAHGLPVIVSESCNLPEILASGAGIVVKCQVEQICAAILKVFESDASRRDLGLNAIRLVEEKFAWHRIAAQAVRLYVELQG